MELLILYAIGCITTAIVACMYVWFPIMREAAEKELDNEITNNPKLSLFVYFIVMILSAPIVFMTFVVPGAFDSFYNGIRTSIFETSNAT